MKKKIRRSRLPQGKLKPQETISVLGKDTTLKLKPTKFALAAGILVAVAIFATTLLALFTSYSTTLITNIYGSVGYTISITGAFLGAIYAFVDTFIFAFIFAWLYNKLI